MKLPNVKLDVAIATAGKRQNHKDGIKSYRLTDKAQIS